MSNRQLSYSSYTHTINVPFEIVDIPGWLFSLPDAEFQRCSPDHIASGATFTDDGRRMSIAVETIGEATIVQHYVGEVTQPDYCKMVSISDSISPKGRSKVKVVWELRVKKIDESKSEYSNTVTAYAVDETLEFLAKNNIKFEDAAAARQAAGSKHNEGETPLYAESIARFAIAKAKSAV